jgi:hypothetical protein
MAELVARRLDCRNRMEVKIEFAQNNSASPRREVAIMINKSDENDAHGRRRLRIGLLLL